MTTDFCPRRHSVGSRQHFRQILHLTPLHMPVPPPTISSRGIYHHDADNRLHRLHHHQCFHHMSTLLILLGQVAEWPLWKSDSSLYGWRHLQPPSRRDGRCAADAHVVGAPDGNREKSGFDWGVWTWRWVCPTRPVLALDVDFKPF